MTEFKKLTIISILLISWLCIFSQETPKTIIIDNDTLVIKAFPLTQVSNNTETVYIEIASIRERIGSFNDQHIIDSLTQHGRKYLDEETNNMENLIGSMSKRELLETQKEWKKIRNDLESWKEKFNQRSVEIGEISKKTDLMLQEWTLTLEKAKEENAVEQLKITIQSVLDDINELNNDVRNKQNQFYLNQNNVLEFILRVDETLNLLQKETSAIRLTYLSKDAPSIWAVSDSIGSSKLIKMQSRRFIDKAVNNLNVFIEDYKNQISMQILFFAVLLISIFFLNKYASRIDSTTTDFQIAKKLLTLFYLSAFILALFIYIWLYPIIPYVVNEIIRAGILIFSFFMLPFLFNRKFVRYLIAVITALFIMNASLFILDGNGLISRILLYTQILLTGFMLLYLIRKSKKAIQILNLKYWFIINYVAPVLLVFLLIAFIGNTFGFFDLSLLLANASANLVLNAVVLIVIAFILNGIVVVLFETKFFLKSKIISEHKHMFTKWITSGITLGTIALWLNSIIKQLNFEQSFWSWLIGILDISWSVGTSTISLGTVMSVLIIIIITYALVRAVGILLEKEIYPRIIMPRGVPGAISMIIKYIIVGFGFYFVLSASGVDLGKFGLIAGALGVGIGFGLQNIVFNFIAGLVLAFERPIQVGDVIEVGTLMGTVTSIGVRSSNVKTFEGSEVIVPNGNLISKEVINWTLSDRKKRREIQVGVAYGTDPHQVVEILLKVAGDHVNVLDTPAPWATFEGFGDSSLNFKIRFWVPFDIGVTVKSQIAMSIYDALEEAGIQIPFPQQDIYIKSIEKNFKDVTEQKFNTPGFDKNDPDAKSS